jgi:hypothetical protein
VEQEDLKSEGISSLASKFGLAISNFGGRTLVYTPKKEQTLFFQSQILLAVSSGLATTINV